MKAIRPISAAIFAIQILCSNPLHAEPQDKSLPGRYYLTGVMEVGSRLLLLPDGSYEWMLAYGAVDQAQDGSWDSDGSTVTLTARVPSLDGVNFRLGESGKWGTRAGDFLRDRMERGALAARAASCPLPALLREYADDIASFEFGDTAPAASQIAEQKAYVEQRRQSAQAALDRLMPGAGWRDDTDLVEDTDLAVSRYYESLATLRGMEDLGKLAPMKAPQLRLPVECHLPDWEANARAFRGVAVHVFDPEHYLRGDGVQVWASYDKGPLADAVVEEGYAFFPLAKGQRLTALRLHVPGAPNDQDTTFSVSIAEPTVQLVDADLGGLQERTFSYMTLRINPDGSLKPLDGPLARGVYQRQVVTPPTPETSASDADPRAAADTQVFSCSAAGEWEKELGNTVLRLVEYPQEAMRQEMEGTAKVAMQIGRDGQVEWVKIERSSGNPLLDHAALAAARKVRSISAVPCDATGVRAIIPINFRLG